MGLRRGGFYQAGGGESIAEAGTGGREPLRPLDKWDLVINAFVQIPKLPRVLGFVVRRHAWFLPVVIAAEGLTVGLFFFMRKVERELNGPRPRGKR